MDVAGLVLATAAFVGSHLLLSHPYRLRLIRNLGEAGFTGLFAVTALLTLGWMALAYGATNSPIPYWIAPDWWWPIASALMLVASILLAGSLVGNPAFPHPGPRKRAIPAPAGVFAITRHPMNWSFILWALVHLSLWGSARNVIVAGGILLLAGAGSIGQDRKKRAVVGPEWQRWESRTSFVPFAALLAGKLPWRSAMPSRIALGGGLAFWLLVTWLHAPTVSPIAALTEALR